MATRTEAEVRATVHRFVADLAPNREATVEDDSRLIEDLDFHSLALVELAFSLEDEFDLDEIDGESVSDIHTTSDLADYVLSELSTEVDP